MACSSHAQPAHSTKIEITKLVGDRDNEGLYTVRQHIPAGHFGPPHYHSTDYYITVLKGKIRIAYGEKVDTVGVKPMEIGSFFIIPAGKVHYEWFTEETVVQVHGLGPVKTVMVKPSE
jgi:quercetin dioxygenase-like cupin family protein